MRGVLAIQDESRPGSFGIGETYEFIYHLEDATLPMRPYESLLVDKLFGDQQEQRLSDLREKFYTNMGQIKQGLYQAVVDEGHLREPGKHTYQVRAPRVSWRWSLLSSSASRRWH